MRLINHVSDFALFARFFFSCIFVFFVVFRNTTCVHEFDVVAAFDVVAFFNAFRSLYCLRINRIIESKFEFFEIDSSCFYFFIFSISICNQIDYDTVLNLQRTKISHNVSVQRLNIIAFVISVIVVRYIFRMMSLSDLQIFYINDSK